MKRIISLALLFVIFSFSTSNAQIYHPINNWSKEINQKLESFLNSTRIIKERKVAVFDCDGTLLGQAPYYLADEAFIAYSKKKFENKSDSFSKEKMKIIHTMFGGGSTSSPEFVLNRINFMEGMSPLQVNNMGEECFHEKYENKIYPEMRELLGNLEDYGFEIWIVSTSPELLYQQFVHEELGIPIDHILGLRSVISNDVITKQVVLPVPMEAGKADMIQTVIKTRPLFVGGNSRGDLEMMNLSTGIKLVVNPDDEKIETGPAAGAMKGNTLKQYWTKEGAVIVSCKDIPESKYNYSTKDYKVKRNKSSN